MEKLSKAAQEAISTQMSLKSRDIDMCMINALTEDMPRDMLLDSLTLYINKDGGYGNALYIDNYNPNTSVYQIYEAFRLLRMLDFDSTISNDELYDLVINKPLNYLYNREAPIKNRWNANTKSNDNYAHSSIFSYTEENKKLFGYHPTVALVGYTLVLCKPTKAYYKKALKMAEAIINDFYNMNELTRLEMISFNSFLNSIRKANLFIDDQKRIEAKLITLAEGMISENVDDVYGVKALEVADAISSEKIDKIKNLELDYIISSRAPHGLWNHLQGWGYNKYAEEDSAMLKWVGAESVNNYYLLKKYGRLA